MLQGSRLVGLRCNAETGCSGVAAASRQIAGMQRPYARG